MVPSSKIEAIRQGKLSHVKTFMAKEKKKRKRDRQLYDQVKAVKQRIKSTKS
jgi:hypothetical protein